MANRYEELRCEETPNTEVPFDNAAASGTLYPAKCY